VARQGGLHVGRRRNRGGADRRRSGSKKVLRSINNHGQIAGEIQTAEGETHAVLWENGKVTDLGTLGGPFSRPFGINNRGQVVGLSDTASGEGHAVLWKEGKIVDLDLGAFFSPTAINNRGQVVGLSETASGEFHAALLTK